MSVEFPSEPPINSSDQSAQSHADWLTDEVQTSIREMQAALQAGIYDHENGVLSYGATPLENMEVTEKATPVNNAVDLSAGIAIAAGIPFWQTAVEELEIVVQTFTAGWSRIDVVELNIANHEIKVLLGTQQLSPSPPALDTDAIPIAYIYVNEVATVQQVIEDADDGTCSYITDERDMIAFSADWPEDFTDLDDTPSSYSGEAGKVPAVNSGETALEFVTVVEDFVDLGDVPASYSGEGGKAVAVNSGETALEFVTVVEDFVDLGDVPASYSGEGGKAVAVNSGETALEFVTLNNAADFTDLDDTPASYSGEAGKIAAVNSGETALEFIEFGDRPMILTAQGATPAETGGCADAVLVEESTYKTVRWMLDFDKDTNERAYWPNLAMPVDMKAGGTIKAKIHWTCLAGTASGVVHWAIGGIVQADGDDLDVNPATSLSGGTDTLITNGYLHISAEITVAFLGTVGAGKSFLLQVLRDAAAAGDTLDVDARLLGVELWYETA